MRTPLAATLLCTSLLASTGCGKSNAGDELVLAAYTTPREAYGKAILPAFIDHWKDKTGKTIAFKESYQGSGAQSRSVAEGFEADIVALSLAPDVQRLVDADLVDATWDDGTHGGRVSRSIVVIAVREGNPKNIKDWSDLARSDVEVLTPNVRTSGGAMWNVAAIYGAALRGQAGVPADDPAAAEKFLASILANVRVMDKGARESLVNFESGVGDAAITYENEVLEAQRSGKPIEYVIPKATLLIENPVAVVKAYATKHGSTEVAEGFVSFLTEEATQTSFAEYGYRPVVDGVEGSTKFPAVEHLFTVADLGGWEALQEKVFATDAVYDRALAQARP